MKKEIALRDGRTARIVSFTGKVIGDRQWTDTRLHSTPAAGVVTAQGAVIGGGQNVHSTSVSKHEFWLRRHDGVEQAFTLHDQALQVRDGHVVTVYLGSVTTQSSDAYLGAHQHTTGHFHNFLVDGKLVDVCDSAGVINRKGSFLQNFIQIGLFLSVIGIPLLVVDIIVRSVKNRNKMNDFRDQFLAAVAEFDPGINEQVDQFKSLTAVPAI